MKEERETPARPADASEHSKSDNHQRLVLFEC